MRFKLSDSKGYAICSRCHRQRRKCFFKIWGRVRHICIFCHLSRYFALLNITKETRFCVKCNGLAPVDKFYNFTIPYCRKHFKEYVRSYRKSSKTGRTNP